MRGSAVAEGVRAEAKGIKLEVPEQRTKDAIAEEVGGRDVEDGRVRRAAIYTAMEQSSDRLVLNHHRLVVSRLRCA